jgi:hypothetical protein
MFRNPKETKKPYSSPSLVVLDAEVAKTKLQSNGDRTDPDVRTMLSLADEQLKKREAKSHSR